MSVNARRRRREQVVEPEAEERVVEREAVLDADAAEVWEGLTDESLLRDWFADEAEIDPVEGGEVAFRFGDGERRGTVVEADPERRLAFTWERPGEGQSLVELTLEPVTGGTRLVVVERATPGPVALAGAGWEARLSGLGLLLERGLVVA